MKEGLEAFPLDVVLTGAVGGKESKLTPKQREFAKQIALGETKAGAYRKAYDSKGKPATQSRHGQALLKRDAIQTQAEAFRAAIEAQKLASPAHLRALVIDRLTRHAIDETIKPSERLRALQLLGTVTEVAAFTERREVVQVKDSAQIKERLMQTLSMLKKQGAKDVEYTEGDSLLAELAEARATDPGQDESEGDETLPEGHPPSTVDDTETYIHSNPHNGTNEPHLPQDTPPATPTDEA